MDSSVADAAGAAGAPRRGTAACAQRGSRSLVSNLAAASKAGGAPGAAAAGGKAPGGEEEEAFVLSEQMLDKIEEVVEMLLTGLRDQDTVVRWAAAKGIGRVTMRLPHVLADDVVQAVLELFTPIEGAHKLNPNARTPTPQRLNTATAPRTTENYATRYPARRLRRRIVQRRCSTLLGQARSSLSTLPEAIGCSLCALKTQTLTRIYYCAYLIFTHRKPTTF